MGICTVTLTGIEPVLKAVEDYMRCSPMNYDLPDFEKEIKQRARFLTAAVSLYADGIAQAHVDVSQRLKERL